MPTFEEIYYNVLKNNRLREYKTLSIKTATFSKHAKRRTPEKIPLRSDIRNPFAHDADRIMHCNAFARYMDKTQVFFQIKNDHIARRSLHVQMVSRIARTVGRFLRLNEDLIEAIAIGHDIGHTPFGHAGEAELAKILEKNSAGSFVHNAQSIRMLDKLEKHGKGLNLTLQVLNGILGHNGEKEFLELTPNKKNLSWEMLDKNVSACLTYPRSERVDSNIFPSTMEGCVVRLADLISYLGKDFEDAITLGIVKREELPLDIVHVLGSTNKEIINNLCRNILENSFEQQYIKFSPEVFEALRAMKDFNYKKIYYCDLISSQREKFSKMVEALFCCYMDDLEHGKVSSDIFKHFIVHHQGEYWETERKERMVADYIAGMTDQYFLKQYELKFIPQRIDYNAIESISSFRLK